MKRFLLTLCCFFIFSFLLYSQTALTFKAYIDGEDKLIISGSNVQWHHLDTNAAPGRQGFQNLPTYLNGVQWLPSWPDNPSTENKQPCFSSINTSLSPALPAIEQNLCINIISARGSATIAQQPKLNNNYTLVIDFNDEAFQGADWYEVTIFASSPASIACASVNANGSVNLTWAASIDTLNSFNSYHIFSSKNATGPFNEIDSIFNINQTTYTDAATANANNQSVYYFIKTRTNCNGNLIASSSDTISTILLNAINPDDGTAVLTWNALHNPNLPTSSGWYHIYKEYPTGTWTLIDSTQNLTYTDSIKLCKAFINYYVSIDDDLPCTSTSSVAGETFQDVKAPVIPLIDSVTVNTTTGYSTISWTASPSSDTHGYIIYENINGKCIPIDTVYGASTTNYINTHNSWANPDSTSLSYTIAAFDSCKNTSPININFQKTIYLTTEYDICNKSATLSWTPYINMKNGLKGYNIFVSKNNGSVTLLATNQPSNLSYTHSALTNNATYIYFIQAIDSTGNISSTSNLDTVHARFISIPKFVYLKHASVISSSYVEIKAIIDTTAYISGIKILRSDTIIGPYVQVGYYVTPINLLKTFTYKDYSASVNEKSYYYKVVIVDSCGNNADTSNIGRTIFISGSSSSNMKNYLIWNEFEQWLGSVQSYNVYRRYDDVPNTLLATLPAGSTTYTDDVSSPTLTSSSGTFTYSIEAFEGNGNPYLCQDSSMSNEVDIVQMPRTYIPNAFVPNGQIKENKTFLPINVFVDETEYQFLIYNRWGVKVFQTNDSHEGWDGKYNNNPAPQGVYVYYINYKDSGGKYIKMQGSVTLMK